MEKYLQRYIEMGDNANKKKQIQVVMKLRKGEMDIECK